MGPLAEVKAADCAQYASTVSRLSRFFPSHFLSMCNSIFTVKGSLRFGIDSYCLNSEMTFLMHCASWPHSLKSKHSYLWLRVTDDTAVRQFLAVPHFVVVLSMVLPCARYRVQSDIALFLSLWQL